MVDIKRARELLGKKGQKMTDEEIIKVVEHLKILANIVIDGALDNKRGVVEDKKPRA